MDGGDGVGRSLDGSLGEEGGREPGAGMSGAHREGCLDQTTQDSECGAKGQRSLHSERDKVQAVWLEPLLFSS